MTTTILTDSNRNTTELQLIPPVYIGDTGIAYGETVSAPDPGGPYVTILVNTADKLERVSAVRGNGKIVDFLKKGDAFESTLDAVNDYEPISLTKYFSTGLKATTEFDCVYRAARSGTVIYRIR